MFKVQISATSLRPPSWSVPEPGLAVSRAAEAAPLLSGACFRQVSTIKSRMEVWEGDQGAGIH